MLQLKDVVKDYPTATTTVHALRSVSLNFRESEFVAILGPSGCGKTTMLNIIGGLDRYTSGDLVIGGVSTKEFDDEHWDAYRNATIGFVFQSYNLIPHLTVLENVDLALSLVGEKKKVRRAKAVSALHLVNMHEHINKKPNQLSGGQMQRVAIARAIVNDPKIILADEPTGALDSELSVQVMDILKDLAKTRLVIMVTHNAELAYQYATRICRFKDGQLVEDTNPYNPDEENCGDENLIDDAQDEIAQNVTTDVLEEQNQEIKPEIAQNDEGKKEKRVSNRKRKQAMKKLGDDVKETFDKLGLNSLSKKKKRRDRAFKPTSMSAGMAFGLSLRNLISKKRRTFLTAFAGSIGIIGLALVLSISNGFSIFVDDMQTDMLAGIPLGIYQYNVKDSAVMDMMLNMTVTSTEGLYPDSDEISVNQGGDSTMGFITSFIESFLDGVTKNDLTEEFAEYMKAMPKEYYSSMSVLYGLRFNMVREIKDESGAVVEYKDISQLPGRITAVNVASTVLGENNLQSTTWQMLVGDEQNMLKSYDLIGENSRYPQNKNEILLCINEDNSINQSLLESFGFDYDADHQYEADDFIGQTFTLLDNDDYYQMKDDNTACEYPGGLSSKYDDYYEDQEFLRDACESESANKLTVVGVIRKKKGSVSAYVNSAFCYTPELSEYVLETSYNSKIALAQRNLDVDNENLIKKTTVFGDKLEDQEIMQGNSIADLMDTSGVLKYTYLMRALGAEKSPSYITVYPDNVTQKENAGNYINAWNGQNKGNVGYFDVSAMFLYNVNIILDLVSTMLIAVASISLVVSTVMIGVITSNSVIERIREIGILRAIGARKKDIRNVFIAETSLIGLSSGLIGITLTYILCPIISLIIKAVTGIGSLLQFNPLHALLLVCLSLLLTIISGIIPAINASRKNVVDALRVD